MGKNLNNIIENRRVVLFEKLRFYYYERSGGMCLESCNVKRKQSEKYDIKIGSSSCQECEFNIGYKNNSLNEYGENYIICRKIFEATKSI